MRTTTLAVIIRGVGDKLETPLGEKKKGEIGTGRLSAPGGKLEQGETIEECLLREAKEEWYISLEGTKMEKVTVITFWAEGEAYYECHVFLVRGFSGELVETADTLKPEWYSADNLPFQRMYESDRSWYSRVLSGEKFRANVYYNGLAKDFSHIEFLPWQVE